jgi:hypothetical protein
MEAYCKNVSRFEKRQPKYLSVGFKVDCAPCRGGNKLRQGNRIIIKEVLVQGDSVQDIKAEGRHSMSGPLFQATSRHHIPLCPSIRSHPLFSPLAH